MFEDSHAAPPPSYVTATIDGAARGNPGPAAYGVLFEDAEGKTLAQLSAKLGKATNNVAEYRALLAALDFAHKQGWRALKVRTDSELLANQIRGRFKVKNADLKVLHQQARELISTFDYFSVEAVPRKLTRAADKLANAALDGRRVALRRAAPDSGQASDRRPVRKTVRAVYQDGVLKPLEPLDIPDSIEVEVTLRKPTR